jgi:hypothetical protein
MANGIVGGLEDVLGLDTTAGTGELQQAIAALQAVGVPSIAQLTLPELQKYVSAGVLSPQQYQAISADPNAYQQIASQADQSGTNAQKAALSQLGGIAQTGSTPIMRAQMANNLAQTNQAMQAARSGIMENAQERGVAGGGLEFLNQLTNEQGNAQNANLGAVNAGANNAQLALQALSNQGTLGSGLQGQENQMAQAKAQAAQQIAQYNSQLQSAANQYNTQNANAAQAANLANAQNISNQNTGNANYRTQYNAQLPGQEYNMQMQKAQGLAGAYGNMGQLKQQQAAGQNQFIGGLLGAGATLGGDYLMGQGIGGVMKSGAIKAPTPNSPNSVDQVQGNQADTYANSYPYSHGGEVKAHDPKTGLHASAYPIQMNQGGMCYAQGGEVHDHRLCMQAGGPVPGDDSNMPMGQDDTSQDVIPANLSPHEIVLPRSVSQAPNAPDAAATFVGQIKGQMPMPKFSDVIKMLEDNGLELRLTSAGDSNAL